MADPTNVLAVDDLKRRVQLEIVPMIATERAVTEALAGVHGGSANMSAGPEAGRRRRGQCGRRSKCNRRSAKRSISIGWRTDSEDAPVIKIVNLILVQALKEKASDIHIEPFQSTLKLRYRIDGELIAGGVAAEGAAARDHFAYQDSRRPQHRRAPRAAGRPFPHPGLGKEVDLRISILPTAHGEKIVIRILDKAALTG